MGFKMTRYDYNEETKDFINNVKETDGKQINAIKSAFKTHYNNIESIFKEIENLQRENGLLKKILKEMIVNDSCKIINDNIEYKKFLKID